MQVTKAKVIQLQTLKRRLLLGDDSYRNMIAAATDGRTTSTKELTECEAESLIKGLAATLPPAYHSQESNTMRKKILSYCHKLHWTTPAGKVDMERLNAWMLKSSYLHKPLMDYRYEELPALVSQFEKVYKSYLRNV